MLCGGCPHQATCSISVGISGMMLCTTCTGWVSAMLLQMVTPPGSRREH